MTRTTPVKTELNSATSQSGMAPAHNGAPSPRATVVPLVGQAVLERWGSETKLPPHVRAAALLFFA